MPVEVRVPSLGESINEVVVSSWLKKAGDAVGLDESVVEIESDKATVEVPAPAAGRIVQVLKAEGESAGIGDVLAIIEEGAFQTQAPAASQTNGAGPAAPAHSPVSPPAPSQPGEPPRVMPSAARIAETASLAPQQIQGTGPGGRVLKEDALRAVEQQSSLPLAPAAPEAPAKASPQPAPVQQHSAGGGLEESVPLSPIRKRIAERLVSSKQEMALLTTFNEIDMGNVMALRKLHQDRFTEKYGVKLGFMSFFIKAAIEALKLFPQVNAELRDNAIVYKNYYDIGIAVGGGKGLLVPVIRGADRLSFGELEQVIADLGARAQKNKIDLSELEGGTFTISNGGIYGSLMSTPIVNPPQSAILGLHAIQDRPVAREGQVVIRPMMYVALTYDHRIIDGRESVTFLRRIKDCLEDPARMLLEV